jgi:hypothetical protein
MTAVPADTPVTTPVDVPTTAIAALLLLHVPAIVASDRAFMLPLQIVAGPAIDAGAVVTVTVLVTLKLPQALETV